MPSVLRMTAETNCSSDKTPNCVHFLHLASDVAGGGGGVGEQMAGAVEVLEDKLVEVFGLCLGIAGGVGLQRLGALGHRELKSKD